MLLHSYNMLRFKLLSMLNFFVKSARYFIKFSVKNVVKKISVSLPDYSLEIALPVISTASLIENKFLTDNVININGDSTELFYNGNATEYKVNFMVIRQKFLLASNRQKM